jgi:hypothetical protein
MDWVSRPVALIVLALWSACVVRCEMEMFVHSTAMTCCGEPGGESDETPVQPRHCVCGLFQSGGFISQKSGVSIPLPDEEGLLMLTKVVAADNFLLTPSQGELTHSPPELLSGWQFFLHEPGLPRAPTSVS